MNVKEVYINGQIPYSIHDQDLLIKLGMMNQPSFGIRIQYFGRSLVANEHGGKTTVYEFVIEGTEGVSLEWIDSLIRDIRFTPYGIVGRVKVIDVDNQTELR